MTASVVVRPGPHQVFPPPTAGQVERGFRLLSFTADILARVLEQPIITTRELARESGRTERSVFEALRRLQSEGLLHRRRLGRRNAYVADRAAVARRLEEEGGALIRQVLASPRAPAALDELPRHRIGGRPG